MSPQVKSHVFSFLWNLLLGSAVLLLTYYGAPRTYESFYCEYITSCGGGWADYGQVVWVVVVYTLLTTMFLSGFGALLRYLWIAVLLLPIFLVIIRMIYPQMEDVVILVYWMLCILIGLGTGFLARKVLGRLAPGFMANLN